MAEKKKIFVVSGYHYHFAECDHDIITDVFDNCEDAAKLILDTLTETFPDDSDLFTLKGCMYGNSYCNGNEEVYLKLEEFSI